MVCVNGMHMLCAGSHSVTCPMAVNYLTVHVHNILIVN